MPPEAALSYDVSTKATWSDAWVPRAHLICSRLQLAVLPTIQSASLLWRVGRLMQHGETTFADYDPLDVVGHYVRIEIPDLSIDWVGYIVSEGATRNADEDDGGSRVIYSQDQQFTAVGLEWFLTRGQVDSSVHYKTATTTDRIERAVGYNTGQGDGRAVTYANRGNKDTRVSSGGPVFAQDPSHATEWNALEIIDNLLLFHGARDQNGNPAPIAFSTPVSAADNYLNWYKPTVRAEGRTVLDVISTVIDRRRGLVGWFDYSPGDGQVTLQVSSSLEAAVVLPGGSTIPAAATSIAYNFDQDSKVRRASVRGNGSQRYDRVRVRGGRRRSVMTVSIGDGNLETSWSAADETAYKTAEGTNADKNDRFRRANKFSRVYRAFRIPANWDGRAGDGQGGTQNYVSPRLPPGSVSVIDGEPYNLHSLRFLRNMPLLEGLDYSDATSPMGNLPADTNPEYLQSFALAKHGTKFVFADRSADHLDEDEAGGERLKYSYGLYPLAGEPGFDVRPSSGLPHALAKNHFDSGGPGESRVTPELDYEDMLFTVCAEWDAYCEGYWPTAVPAAAPVQQLLIHVNERYRLDWLASGTIYDIDDQGAPKTVSFGGPVQDDRRILEDLARLAYEWYRVPRATLEVEYQNLQNPVGLGTLITTIGTAGNPTEQTVNATVTQITLLPETGESSLSAGYAELDFGGLV